MEKVRNKVDIAVNMTEPLSRHQVVILHSD